MQTNIHFRAFPGLANPHVQTLLGALLGRGAKEPLSNQKRISLPDGDQLSLEITAPKGWKRTVVLVHGLCGSHRSPYMVRMVKRLEAFGIRSVRMNLRGCGSGKGLAKQIYHSGRSEDVLAVLKALKEDHPDSPITLIGYSLGANIVLKLAGELGDEGENYLNKVIAISPPADLHSSVQLFAKPENGIYEQRFSKELLTHALELDETLNIPKKLSVIEFDHLFTAPRAGFANALDYYAKDDPLVSHSTLDSVEIPFNVQIFKTQRGGHLGFLGNPFCKGGFRWLDSQIIDWIL